MLSYNPERKEVVTTTNIINTIVHVNRSASPVYPAFVKAVMHPQLEHTGPAEFDLAKVKLWRHTGQKGWKVISGHIIYRYLKNTVMIENCLSLLDGQGIQKKMQGRGGIRSLMKGLDLYQSFFNGQSVGLWKSVIRNNDGLLVVPCLNECCGKVGIIWMHLECDWNAFGPAGQFGD